MIPNPEMTANFRSLQSLGFAYVCILCFVSDTGTYPSNLTVSKNAGIEPRAVAEFALTVRTVSTVL
jgi:hypothetical protein